MTAFNPGDRVRLTALPPASGSIESTVDANGHFLGWAIWSNAQGDVEIIEPADDPSKDPVPTFRRSPETGDLYARVADDEDWRSLTSAYTNWKANSEVVGWEKSDPIPGTLAAGHVPVEVVAEARRLIRGGLKIQAVKYLRDQLDQTHPLYDLRQAVDFVKGLA